jgi:hypothetical protein
MTAVSGSAAFALWVTSDGTTTLTGDYRTLSYTPTIELYDQTAGADGALSYITGREGGDFSIGMVLQATDGSAIQAQFEKGKVGTMTWGEQGSVTTKIKRVAPMICTGAKITVPYNEVIDFTADFKQNGTATLGTF